MTFEEKLNECRKWMHSMFKDIRQLLNAPTWAERCAQLEDQSGQCGTIQKEDKSGVNFLAALSVLMGLETVARLAIGPTRLTHEKIVETFVRENPRFPPRYRESIRIVWQLLRHGHAHHFIPRWLKITRATGTQWLSPTVRWIPKSIDHIMQDFSGQNEPTYANAHLGYCEIRANHFLMIFLPQVAYVHLKKAYMYWIAEVQSDSNKMCKFEEGYTAVFEDTWELNENQQGEFWQVVETYLLNHRLSSDECSEYSTQTGHIQGERDESQTLTGGVPNRYLADSLTSDDRESLTPSARVISPAKTTL